MLEERTVKSEKGKLDHIVEKIFWLLVFFFPASIALRNVFLGLTFIFFVINKLVKKDFTIPKNKFNKYLGLFFLFSILSMLKASNLELSISHLVSPLIRYLAFYFIAMDLIDQDNINKYLNIILLSNLVLISYGLYVDYFTKGEFFYRSNGIGTVSSFMIILFTTLVVYKKTKVYKKIVLALGSIGSLIALITTYSRGAFLAFGGAILVWITLVIWEKLSSKIGSKKLIASIIVIIICIMTVTGLLLPEKLINRFERIKNIEANRSLKTRIEMYKSSLTMIKENPLLGVGIGNYKPNYVSYIEESNISKSSVDLGHDHPHNLFLYIAVEQGIISLIIFLMIYFKSYQLAVRNYFNQQEKSYFGLVLIGILTALFIHSLVDTTVRYGHVGFYVILFGVFNLKIRSWNLK